MANEFLVVNHSPTGRRFAVPKHQVQGFRECDDFQDGVMRRGVEIEYWVYDFEAQEPRVRELFVSDSFEEVLRQTGFE